MSFPKADIPTGDEYERRKAEQRSIRLAAKRASTAKPDDRLYVRTTYSGRRLDGRVSRREGAEE